MSRNATPLPPASPIAGLAKAERLFTMAVRWWVHGYRSDQDPMPCLFREFEAHGVRNAVFPLNEFMAIVAETAQQSIAVHCPKCLDLTDDEQNILRAAHLAQAGAGTLAERALSVLLTSSSGAASALRPLEDLGQTLRDAGLYFGGGGQSPGTVNVH
jgi:hypothetical protein